MNNLEQLLADINKQYKSDIIKVGEGYNEGGKIPFSSPRANYLTRGGIPRGKSTEFSGTESGGKTTSAIDIVANAQHIAEEEYFDAYTEISTKLEALTEKNNKSDAQEIKKLTAKLEELKELGPQSVLYADTENTLDTNWAELNGVDISKLILLRPDNQTAEQVLQMLIEIIKTGRIILAVLDSIPMLVPQQIFEEDLEKKMYAGVSGPLTTFSAKISPILAKHNTAFLGINQNRDNMDNDFAPDNTPGGRAWKHLQSLRVQFRKGALLDQDNDELPQRAEMAYGNLVMMNILKNKTSKPDRRIGYYSLRYDIGIDVLSDTIDLAIKYGIIKQSGAWFSILDLDTGEVLTNEEGNEIKFQGRSKLIGEFRENEQLFAKVYEKVDGIILED